MTNKKETIKSRSQGPAPTKTDLAHTRPGKTPLMPATMISMPRDIMMRPMIRVTTLMPVLPISLNSRGAARKMSQEQQAGLVAQFETQLAPVRTELFDH